MRYGSRRKFNYTAEEVSRFQCLDITQLIYSVCHDDRPIAIRVSTCKIWPIHFSNKISYFALFNPSTAKGVKLPPRAHFCLLLRQLEQQPKFLRWLFLNMFSARNGGSLDFLCLRIMTSWRVKVTSFFLKKMKLASTHLTARELWKTE